MSPATENQSAVSENVVSRTKAEGYTSFLCFHCDATDHGGRKCVLKYPNSCCGCYDGQVMCSHQTAMLLSFHLLQAYDETRVEFVKDLPDPPQGNDGERKQYACGYF